jgi:hypothetical protein
MKKILFAHGVTQIVLERFQRAQHYQEKIGFGVEKDRHVIISDEKTEIDYPKWQIIRAKLFDKDGYFNLPRWRNVAFRFALERDYEWVITVDADQLIVEMTDHLPPTGFGGMMNYIMKEWESVEDLSRTWKTRLSEFVPSTCFVIRRDAFEKNRMCEEYSGYGYEEHDFVNNVCRPEGYPQSYADIHSLHLWHVVTHPKYVRETLVINREIYLRRAGLVGNKVDPRIF